MVCQDKALLGVYSMKKLIKITDRIDSNGFPVLDFDLYEILHRQPNCGSNLHWRIYGDLDSLGFEEIYELFPTAPSILVSIQNDYRAQLGGFKIDWHDLRIYSRCQVQISTGIFVATKDENLELEFHGSNFPTKELYEGSEILIFVWEGNFWFFYGEEAICEIISSRFKEVEEVDLPIRTLGRTNSSILSHFDMG